MASQFGELPPGLTRSASCRSALASGPASLGRSTSLNGSGRAFAPGAVRHSCGGQHEHGSARTSATGGGGSSRSTPGLLSFRRTSSSGRSSASGGLRLAAHGLGLPGLPVGPPGPWRPATATAPDQPALAPVPVPAPLPAHAAARRRLCVSAEGSLAGALLSPSRDPARLEGGSVGGPRCGNRLVSEGSGGGGACAAARCTGSDALRGLLVPHAHVRVPYLRPIESALGEGAAGAAGERGGGAGEGSGAEGGAACGGATPCGHGHAGSCSSGSPSSRDEEERVALRYFSPKSGGPSPFLLANVPESCSGSSQAGEACTGGAEAE